MSSPATAGTFRPLFAFQIFTFFNASQTKWLPVSPVIVKFDCFYHRFLARIVRGRVIFLIPRNARAGFFIVFGSRVIS